MYLQTTKKQNLFVMGITLVMFLITQVICPGTTWSQEENETTEELFVSRTQPYSPLLIQGLNIDFNDALKINFLINKGDSGLSGDSLKTETEKLIKYFLASLTTPEDEMWVNLSIYEEDRIIPENFGKTTMGSDLLAQDYVLKKVMSSMMYPDSPLGENFWNKVYTRAREEFGITDIPLNTFNKVWIIASDAQIYEHSNGALVVDSHMKVMMEEDYLAMELSKQKENTDIRPYDKGSQPPQEEISKVTSEILRKILIPELEKEVNQGELFANLRQIYNAMILASWYKTALKQSLLGQIYADKGKTDGIEVENKNAILDTYNEYVQSVKKGVYTFIKEEYDEASKEIISRKYFSGGVRLKSPKVSRMDRDVINQLKPEDIALATVELKSTGYIPPADLAAASTGALQKQLMDALPFLKNLHNGDNEGFQGIYYNGTLIAQAKKTTDLALTATVKDLKQPGAGFLGSDVFADFMNKRFPDGSNDDTIVDIVIVPDGNIFITGPAFETGIVRLPAMVKKDNEVSEPDDDYRFTPITFYWPQIMINANNNDDDDDKKKKTGLYYNGILIATENQFIPGAAPDGTIPTVPETGTFDQILANFLNTQNISTTNISVRQVEGTNKWLVYGPQTAEKEKSPSAQAKQKSDLGGIDLHPENLNMKIQKNDEGGIIPIAPQVIENINIKGFTPVIIEIAPVKNLPVLIGFADQEKVSS